MSQGRKSTVPSAPEGSNLEVTLKSLLIPNENCITKISRTGTVPASGVRDRTESHRYGLGEDLLQQVSSLESNCNNCVAELEISGCIFGT